MRCNGVHMGIVVHCQPNVSMTHNTLQGFRVHILVGHVGGRLVGLDGYVPGRFHVLPAQI